LNILIITHWIYNSNIRSDREVTEMNRNEKTYTIVMTAMMTCLVLLTTYTFKIPTPFQGYVHLGDAMIFLSVLVVGRKNGAVAAAFGSALADLLGGYVAFAPWTFVIKGLMALVMGWFIDFMTKKQSKSLKVCGVPLIEIVGMVIAGAVMVLGYGVADAVLAGNIMTGILSMPANCGQFAAGVVIASVLAAALYKTPAKKYFTYRLDEAR
jgi:putative membrane spanning protein